MRVASTPHIVNQIYQNELPMRFRRLAGVGVAYVCVCMGEGEPPPDTLNRIEPLFSCINRTEQNRTTHEDIEST